MPFQRGATPSPRNRLAAAMPHQTGPAPSNFGVLPKTLQTWGNDYLGDCVAAEEAAAMAAYSVMRGAPEFLIPDNVLIAWAQKHGYANGANLVEVMDLMSNEGIEVSGKVYKDGSHKTVIASDWQNLASAIYTGPVKIAVAANQLEHAGAGTRNGWVLKGAHLDQDSDHCIGIWSYGTAQYLADLIHNTYGVGMSLGGLQPDTPSVIAFTWKSVGIIEYWSLLKITTELWVRSPTTLPDPAPDPVPQPMPPPGPTPRGPIMLDPVAGTISAPGWTFIPSPD